MEQLIALLPSLSGQQLDALATVAKAMVETANPAPKPDEWLTVTQLAEEYRGICKGTIYNAISSGSLAYTTPNGQTKPYYVKREDFEAWLHGRSRRS